MLHVLIIINTISHAYSFSMCLVRILQNGIYKTRVPFVGCFMCGQGRNGEIGILNSKRVPTSERTCLATNCSRISTKSRNRCIPTKRTRKEAIVFDAPHPFKYQSIFKGHNETSCAFSLILAIRFSYFILQIFFLPGIQYKCKIWSSHYLFIL